MSPQDLGWCSFSTGVPLPGLGSGQLSLQLPPPSGSAPPCTPHSGSARGPRGPATQPNAGRCRGSYPGPPGAGQCLTGLQHQQPPFPRPAPLPCPVWTTHTPNSAQSLLPEHAARVPERSEKAGLEETKCSWILPRWQRGSSGLGLGVTPQARTNQAGVAVGKTR